MHDDKNHHLIAKSPVEMSGDSDHFIIDHFDHWSLHVKPMHGTTMGINSSEAPSAGAREGTTNAMPSIAGMAAKIRIVRFYMVKICQNLLHNYELGSTWILVSLSQSIMCQPKLFHQAVSWSLI